MTNPNDTRDALEVAWQIAHDACNAETAEAQAQALTNLHDFLAPRLAAVQPVGAAHDLFKTGDADAPAQILDRNGEVALAACRRCGRAEVELSQPCDHVVLRDFQEGQWWVKELDQMAENLPALPENRDLKRAVAVVHHMLRVIAAVQPERKRVTDAEIAEMVGNWFAEAWAQEKARGLLDDFARATTQQEPQR